MLKANKIVSIIYSRGLARPLQDIVTDVVVEVEFEIKRSIFSGIRMSNFENCQCHVNFQLRLLLSVYYHGTFKDTTCSEADTAILILASRLDR